MAYGLSMLHVHRSDIVGKINTTSVLNNGIHLTGHRKIALAFDNVKHVNE